MSTQDSLGVDGFPTPAEELLDDDDFAVIAEDYLGRLCAKDGCANVPTPGYRIHTWLGKAMDHKLYRGDMVDAEGLIEDAYSEAAKRVTL